ncbi:MAG: glycosyltransferase, partial [Candidatus Bathyarchaeota archaeon]|nr:glycosyltransferase [Candidatus Bathyarchaeota archaeon]
HVLKKAVHKPLWHPFNVSFFLLQFIKIAKKNRVSLIRGRSVGLSGFLGLVTGKVLRVPFIISLGGNTRLNRELKFRFGDGTRLKMLKKIFADLVEILILRNADCIMVRNAYTQNYVISLKVKEEKIEIVSWILKRDIFDRKMDRNELDRFVEQFNLDLKKPIILYVGRLEPAKQVDVVMEAVPFVLKEKPNTQFIFIGDGSLWEKLKERAENLGVTDKVHFLGYQPTNVVKSFLSIASVVWIPMSGYVVFEAAAFRAPIVAFDVDWHHEFISNGTSGLLVENRDYRKMAEAVITTLENPVLARKCGEGARRKLVEEHNPEDVKRKEVEVYEKILEDFQ